MCKGEELGLKKVERGKGWGFTLMCVCVSSLHLPLPFLVLEPEKLAVTRVADMVGRVGVKGKGRGMRYGGSM